LSLDNELPLADAFRQRFQAQPLIFRAPGRTNLIGEHTDYNGGFVLPAAIDFYCWVAISPRDDKKLAIYSENLDALSVTDLSSGSLQPTHSWTDYPLGVAAELQRLDHTLRGANLYIRGRVPIGAGLSSSAALEVSAGLALLQNSGISLDRVQLALLCQRAENNFAGARCGIMDQFISCFGRSNAALFLDCRSLQFEVVSLPETWSIALCNTNVKHAIAESGYNTRRAECEQAVALIRESIPNVQALRDVTLPQLQQLRAKLPDVLYRRSRHIVTENLRVQQTVQALAAGDFPALKPILLASHESLRDDYEVSCRELDIMVELALAHPGVHGARMTGGGFGGCTVNLVAREAVQSFHSYIESKYAEATGLAPDVYITSASDGASQVAQVE
jgi:galactokinase